MLAGLQLALVAAALLLVAWLVRALWGLPFGKGRGPASQQRPSPQQQRALATGVVPLGEAAASARDKSSGAEGSKGVESSPQKGKGKGAGKRNASGAATPKGQESQTPSISRVSSKQAIKDAGSSTASLPAAAQEAKADAGASLAAAAQLASSKPGAGGQEGQTPGPLAGSNSTSSSHGADGSAATAKRQEQEPQAGVGAAAATGDAVAAAGAPPPLPSAASQPAPALAEPSGAGTGKAAPLAPATATAAQAPAKAAAQAEPAAMEAPPRLPRPGPAPRHRHILSLDAGIGFLPGEDPASASMLASAAESFSSACGQPSSAPGAAATTQQGAGTAAEQTVTLQGRAGPEMDSPPELRVRELAGAQPSPQGTPTLSSKNSGRQSAPPMGLTKDAVDHRSSAADMMSAAAAATAAVTVAAVAVREGAEGAPGAHVHPLAKPPDALPYQLQSTPQQQQHKLFGLPPPSKAQQQVAPQDTDTHPTTVLLHPVLGLPLAADSVSSMCPPTQSSDLLQQRSQAPSLGTSRAVSMSSTSCDVRATLLEPPSPSSSAYGHSGVVTAGKPGSLQQQQQRGLPAHEELPSPISEKQSSSGGSAITGNTSPGSSAGTFLGKWPSSSKGSDDGKKAKSGKRSNPIASIGSSILATIREKSGSSGHHLLGDHKESRPPRAMFSSKDGEKRAIFKTNKVSPTPTFYAMVHPKPASSPTSDAGKGGSKAGTATSPAGRSSWGGASGGEPSPLSGGKPQMLHPWEVEEEEARRLEERRRQQRVAMAAAGVYSSPGGYRGSGAGGSLAAPSASSFYSAAGASSSAGFYEDAFDEEMLEEGEEGEGGYPASGSREEGGSRSGGSGGSGSGGSGGRAGSPGGDKRRALAASLPPLVVDHEHGGSHLGSITHLSTGYWSAQQSLAGDPASSGTGGAAQQYGAAASAGGYAHSGSGLSVGAPVYTPASSFRSTRPSAAGAEPTDRLSPHDEEVHQASSSRGTLPNLAAGSGHLLLQERKSSNLSHSSGMGGLPGGSSSCGEPSLAPGSAYPGSHHGLSAHGVAGAASGSSSMHQPGAGSSGGHGAGGGSSGGVGMGARAHQAALPPLGPFSPASTHYSSLLSAQSPAWTSVGPSPAGPATSTGGGGSVTAGAPAGGGAHRQKPHGGSGAGAGPNTPASVTSPFSSLWSMSAPLEPLSKGARWAPSPAAAADSAAHGEAMSGAEEASSSTATSRQRDMAMELDGVPGMAGPDAGAGAGSRSAAAAAAAAGTAGVKQSLLPPTNSADLDLNLSVLAAGLGYRPGLGLPEDVEEEEEPQGDAQLSSSALISEQQQLGTAVTALAAAEAWAHASALDSGSAGGAGAAGGPGPAGVAQGLPGGLALDAAGAVTAAGGLPVLGRMSQDGAGAAAVAGDGLMVDESTMAWLAAALQQQQDLQQLLALQQQLQLQAQQQQQGQAQAMDAEGPGAAGAGASSAGGAGMGVPAGNMPGTGVFLGQLQLQQPQPMQPAAAASGEDHALAQQLSLVSQLLQLQSMVGNDPEAMSEVLKQAAKQVAHDHLQHQHQQHAAGQQQLPRSMSQSHMAATAAGPASPGMHGAAVGGGMAGLAVTGRGPRPSAPGDVEVDALPEDDQALLEAVIRPSPPAVTAASPRVAGYGMATPVVTAPVLTTVTAIKAPTPVDTSPGPTTPPMVQVGPALGGPPELLLSPGAGTPTILTPTIVTPLSPGASPLAAPAAGTPTSQGPTLLALPSFGRPTLATPGNAPTVVGVSQGPGGVPTYHLAPQGAPQVHHAGMVLHAGPQPPGGLPVVRAGPGGGLVLGPNGSPITVVGLPGHPPHQHIAVAGPQVPGGLPHQPGTIQMMGPPGGGLMVVGPGGGQLVNVGGNLMLLQQPLHLVHTPSGPQVIAVQQPPVQQPPVQTVPQPPVVRPRDPYFTSLTSAVVSVRHAGAGLSGGGRGGGGGTHGGGHGVVHAGDGGGGGHGEGAPAPSPSPAGQDSGGSTG